MTKYDIVTIGDCFEDIFLFPEEAKLLEDKAFSSGRGLCFGYGDKVAIKEIIYQLGGSAANTAANFAKLGLKTSIISPVGGDSQGEKTVASLGSFGVDTSMIRRQKELNSNISVILGFQGDRTIFTYHGARESDDFLPPVSLKSSWIYLAPLAEKSEAVENRIIEIIAKNATGLIWNPGSYQIRRSIKDLLPILKLCNLIFLNKEEACELSKISSRAAIEEAMKIIHSCGTKVIIVTDGAKGAKCYDGQRFYNIPSSGDKRVEATGAGDAFASAFSVNVIKNSSENKNQGFVPDRDLIEKSLKTGIIVSGSVVGNIGAQTGLLTPTEIDGKERELVKIQATVYT